MGLIPTQVFAFPLLITNLYLRKFSNIPLIFVVLFQACIIPTIFLGLNEYFKYTIIISTFILFAYELIFRDKNTNNLIIAISLLLLIFLFIPDLYLQQTKIYFEYQV